MFAEGVVRPVVVVRQAVRVQRRRIGVEVKPAVGNARRAGRGGGRILCLRVDLAAEEVAVAGHLLPFGIGGGFSCAEVAHARHGNDPFEIRRAVRKLRIAHDRNRVGVIRRRELYRDGEVRHRANRNLTVEVKNLKANIGTYPLFDGCHRAGQRSVRLKLRINDDRHLVGRVLGKRVEAERCQRLVRPRREDICAERRIGRNICAIRRDVPIGVKLVDVSVVRSVAQPRPCDIAVTAERRVVVGEVEVALLSP